MGYEKRTYELLKVINREPKQAWEVRIEIGEETYSIQFEATEAEIFSALLNLNQDLQNYTVVMLESFLYEFDVSPEDIRKCYADEVGWGLQCFDCYGDLWIDHNISHERRDEDVVFILEFDPPPLGCVISCHGSYLD